MEKSKGGNTGLSLFLFLGVLSVIGFLLIMAITSKRGVGLPTDAPLYILMAQCLDSSCLNSGRMFLLKSSLNFPPLFYFLLAAIKSFLGLDPFNGARWLNASLFAMNIFLVGTLVYKYAQSRCLALAGALWMLVTIDIIEIHSVAMSEPLFIFLILLWLFLFMDFLEQRTRASFWGCCVAAGLACVTRFAGIPLVLTGVVGMVLLKKDTMFNKALSAGTFILLGLFPILLWTSYNFLSQGAFLAKKFSFYPVSLGVFGEKWLILCLMTVAISLGLLFLDRKDPRTAKSIPSSVATPVLVMSSFILVYVLFLFFVRTFFDRTLFYDANRHFIPVYVLTVIIWLLWAKVWFLWEQQVRLKKVCLWLVCVVYFGMNALHAATWGMGRYDHGVGYDGRDWDGSEIIREAGSLSPKVLIYTNNFDAVYSRAHREAAMIAPKTEWFSGKENMYYRDGVKELRDDLSSGHGVVVYFKAMNSDDGYPTVDELKKDIPLKCILEVSDGAIYVFDRQD